MSSESDHNYTIPPQYTSPPKTPSEINQTEENIIKLKQKLLDNIDKVSKQFDECIDDEYQIIGKALISPLLTSLVRILADRLYNLRRVDIVPCSLFYMSNVGYILTPIIYILGFGATLNSTYGKIYFANNIHKLINIDDNKYSRKEFEILLKNFKKETRSIEKYGIFNSFLLNIFKYTSLFTINVSFSLYYLTTKSTTNRDVLITLAGLILNVYINRYLFIYERKNYYEYFDNLKKIVQGKKNGINVESSGLTPDDLKTLRSILEKYN